MFTDLFQSVDFTYFFLSALLFFAGMYFGPFAVERNIRFLLMYPRWMLRFTRRIFTHEVNPLGLFLLILLLNNLSVMTSFLSGLLVILPPFAAFFTGFNVAVIGFEMLGWRGIWQILFNPVAWLEFPAAFLGFSMAYQLAEVQLTYADWSLTLATLTSLLPIYLKYVFTLLFAAAVLETSLIAHGRHIPEDDET